MSRAEQESNLRNVGRAELKKKSQAEQLGRQREEGRAEQIEDQAEQSKYQKTDKNRMRTLI